MKTYARQIAPEYQESPLMYDKLFWPDNMIAAGNRDFQDRTTPEYDHIIRYLDDMANEWKDAAFRYEPSVLGTWNYNKIRKSHPERDGYPYSLRELLHDYGFNRPGGKEWTTRQRHEWRELLEREIVDDEGGVLKALEIMTGKKWTTGVIRGCVQRDWQEIIYPVDEWTREDLNHFEAEYFNTGTEWIIHDEPDEPEDPENISGYSMYCYGWSIDMIREEIADYTGCGPENVVLYEWTGFRHVSEYKLA